GCMRSSTAFVRSPRRHPRSRKRGTRSADSREASDLPFRCASQARPTDEVHARLGVGWFLSGCGDGFASSRPRIVGWDDAARQPLNGSRGGEEVVVWSFSRPQIAAAAGPCPTTKPRYGRARGTQQSPASLLADRSGGRLRPETAALETVKVAYG